MLDALIIGGGPAGATTGLLLAKAGWSVAIVEKQSYPRRKVCGEFISATSFPLLETLGIADYFKTHAGPEVRRVGLFAAETVLTSAMPQLNSNCDYWGRALGREHLDTVLLEQARQNGATVYQPYTATALSDHISYFTCTISNKETSVDLSARLVILAQGSWERAIYQEHHPTHTPNDFLAFKAHFLNSTLAMDLMPLLAFPNGYGGMVHTDQGRVTLSCSIQRSALHTLREKNPGAHAGNVVLQHITTTTRGVKEALATAHQDGSWLSVGPLQTGIHTQYSNGLFFVGNIAGEAHPIVAEGISMAMQAAWLLSHTLIKQQKKISSRQQLAVIGREYTQLWHAMFAQRVHASQLFAQLAIRPKVTNWLLPVFRSLPNLLTFGAKLSGKTKQII